MNKREGMNGFEKELVQVPILPEAQFQSQKHQRSSKKIRTNRHIPTWRGTKRYKLPMRSFAREFEVRGERKTRDEVQRGPGVLKRRNFRDNHKIHGEVLGIKVRGKRQPDENSSHFLSTKPHGRENFRETDWVLVHHLFTNSLS